MDAQGGLFRYRLLISWIVIRLIGNYNFTVTADDAVSLSHHPFSHGECRGFIQNEEFLEGLLEKLEKFEFLEKASDLFQFRQSNDLRSYEDSDDHIAKLL